MAMMALREAAGPIIHDVYVPHVREMLARRGLPPSLAESVVPSVDDLFPQFALGPRTFVELTQRIETMIGAKIERHPVVYWWPWSELW